MFYSITKEDGYIVGVAKGVSAGNANCSAEDYDRVRASLASRPTAPDGYCYRLDEKLNWVLCEKPIYVPDPDKGIGEEDTWQ
jgi:hypothetical protein